MNKQESKVTLGSMLRRALALVLVLSLVVIPVQFPGVSNAVEENAELTDVYFSEDFSADEEEGTKFQWNENFTSQYEKKIDGQKFMVDCVSGKVNEGNYQFTIANSTSKLGMDGIYLSGMSNGADVTSSWKDYTVSFDVCIDPTVAGDAGNGIVVMAYMNADGEGYGVQITTRNEIDLVQLVKSGTTYIVKRIGALSVECTGSWHHVELKISNITYTDSETEEEKDTNEIFAKVTSTDVTNADKERTHTLVVALAQNVTNTKPNKVTDMPVYDYMPGGTVGVYVMNAPNTTEGGLYSSFTHCVDNVVVTSNTGEVMFADYFSDSRYMEGYATRWDSVSYYNEDYRFVEYKPANSAPSPEGYTGTTVLNGKYYMSATDTRAATYAFLQQKNDEGEYVYPAWEDYTFEIDTEKLYVQDDQRCTMVYARVSMTNGKYSYYTFRLHGYRLFVGKMVNGTHTEGTAAAHSADTGTGLLYVNAGEYKVGISKVKVTFTTVDGVLRIDIMTVATNKDKTVRTYTLTDNNPLPAGSVGFGTALYNGANGAAWAFDNIKVTDSTGVVLVDEGFDNDTAGPILEKETVGLRWNTSNSVNLTNTTYEVASKWVSINASSVAITNNVMNVAFNNPTAEDKNSQFRMDLEMNKDGKDVSGYFADGMLTFQTYIGISDAPVTTYASNYAGIAATNPLSTGALIRVQPVYEGEELLGYTYYRIRVSLNKIHFDKNVYRNGEFELIEDYLPEQNITFNENVSYMLAIRFVGNTITVYRNALRVKDLQPENGKKYTFVDPDENYYKAGSVALWAQAENKADVADGAQMDWNVRFFHIRLNTADADAVLLEQFNNQKYLSGTFANSESPYYIYSGVYGSNATGDVKYTFTNKVFDLTPSDNWNVVDGALIKTTDMLGVHYLTASTEETEDAFAWTGYGMNVDFQLVENGYAGIVLNYNGTEGYELRFNGAQAMLYKISNGYAQLTQLAVVEQALTAGEWITVNVKIVGDTLTYTIAGNTVTMKINESGVLAAGTIGFTGSEGAKFDNITVYALGGAPILNVVDGWIYCRSLSLKVVDDDLDYIVVNNKRYEADENLISLNSAGLWEVTAYDKAGHVTKASFKILMTHEHCYEPTVHTIYRSHEYRHGNYCIYCNKLENESYHTKKGTVNKVYYQECKSCEFDFNLANYNGTDYELLQVAIKAAKTKFDETGVPQEVDLKINLIVRGLEIPQGVILDLNGHYLNAPELICAGQIIDSGRMDIVNEVETKVYGGVRVTSTQGNEPMFGENEWLPLFDETTNYYRFFEYKFDNLGVKEDGEFNKFGMRLTFTNADAYDLLLKNDVQLGFAINWTGLDETLYYTFKASTVETYINAVKAKLEAEQAVTTAMILRVRELEKINQGYAGKMIVTPILDAGECGLYILTGTTVDANPL